MSMQSVGAPNFARFVYCLLSAWVFSPLLMAGVVLPELEPAYVQPGDLLELIIEVDPPDDFRVEIRMLSPPENATLNPDSHGKLQLLWETSPILPERTVLTLQAKNIDNQKIIDTTELLVLRETITVELNTIANQMVSAGRTVSVSISAISSDEETPVITIDRLPRNASFDQNSNGGYTLVWPTDEQDQGEHVFRVTAKHPSENSTVSNASLTVIVGDPSRRKTLPVETNR